MRAPISLRLRSLICRSVIAGLTVLSLTACQSASGPTEVLQIPSVTALAATEPPSRILSGEVEKRAPAAIVIDAATGRVLYAEEADALRYPASLSKLMTLYLTFEQIQAGRLSLDDDLLVSAEAASKPPAKLGLTAGSTIRVRDAIQALAVKSANDVASVIAENLAGSDEAFARAMTAKAKALGMSRTNFVNPSGLPDPRQISTARDIALLARAVRSHFPQFTPLFAESGFDYGGKHYKATNHLLGKVPGVDGMKTGYIRDSGFHLVATCRRGSKRVIVVVLGGKTARARDEEVVALIDRYL
ncbi:D-alanyl-D-alanine carboxypeptidase family protein [Consotaella aegiceratis]|uniref:D-alanyl-D-alanine carboxypeptidase family protein n=1 Tax=Consotaella aegiceratis TaxID=3097961 RepID=UPI002F42CD7A